MAKSFEIVFTNQDSYVKAVDRIVGMIFIAENSRTSAVLMQELRLLKAFSGERSKHNLGFGLWEVAEDVKGQVVAL